MHLPDLLPLFEIIKVMLMNWIIATVYQRMNEKQRLEKRTYRSRKMRLLGAGYIMSIECLMAGIIHHHILYYFLYTFFKYYVNIKRNRRYI